MDREQEALATAIDAYKSGNRAAFNSIHDAYKTRLWYYLRAKTNTRQDAEDLFSIVSMNVAEHITGLENPGALIAWVLALARNRIYDYYKRKLPKHLDTADLNLVDTSEDLEVQTVERQRLRQLRYCIKKLPENKKEHLSLYLWGGVGITEISKRCGIKLNSLKSNIHRAKLAILACLKSHGYLGESTG